MQWAIFQKLKKVNYSDYNMGESPNNQTEWKKLDRPNLQMHALLFHLFKILENSN